MWVCCSTFKFSPVVYKRELEFDEGVIYRSQLFNPIENDLTFHLRQYLARYDETLMFYGVLSKIHHFSIGRKLQVQPPIKKLSFLHRFFS